MPTPAERPVHARRRSILDRAGRWAQRHPFLAYVLVMAAGTIVAWACEYAKDGVAAALCHLRDLLQQRLGGMIEQVLRRPLEP